MPRSRAKVSASSRVISHIRVGAMTRTAGIERRDERVEAQAVVARRRAAVGDGGRAFHPGDVDELARDERPRERGRHRRAIGVERAGLERRQRVVADELLAHVDDVRAHGAEGQRALADLDELGCRVRGRASP